MTRDKLIFILLAVVLFGLPVFMKNPYFLHIMILLFLWTACGTAWNILGGYCGQLSMGHAAYFGIGAYGMALFSQAGFNPWLSLLMGAAMGLPLALLVGGVCFRLRGPYFVLATIALAEVLRLTALAWRDFTHGAVGIMVPSLFHSKIGSYYLILSVAIFTILLTMFLMSRRTGYYFLAIREDEDTAEAIGINTTVYKNVALLISAFFTAMAGGFYASYLSFIEPDIVFATAISVQIAITAIIGGRGTFFGPVLGAALLTFSDESFRSIFQNAHLLIYGLLLVLVILFLPDVPFFHKGP